MSRDQELMEKILDLTDGLCPDISDLKGDLLRQIAILRTHFVSPAEEKEFADYVYYAANQRYLVNR